MRFSYATLEAMRASQEFQATDSSKDAWLLKCLEAVSEYVDQWCARTFRTIAQTRYFTPEWPDKLRVPDLVSVNSILLDQDFDDDYEITLSPTTDYYLYPLNVTDPPWPYNNVRIRSHVVGPYNVFWPGHERSVKIDGVWGWPPQTVLTSATVNETLSATDTTITVSSTNELEAGMTILVGTEQMYITGRAVNTITVDRAVNGTSGATHASSTAIYYYRYPQPITAAVVLQASRIFSRSKTPLGIINVPGEIGSNAINIPKFDPDVYEMLRTYRKPRVL